MLPIRLACAAVVFCICGSGGFAQSPGPAGQARRLAVPNERSSPRRLDRNNLLIYRNARGQARPVKSTDDWRKRRAAVLEGMQQVMGPLPGKKKRCPLNVKIEKESDRGSYVRRLITYASEPGSRVPAYLLIPKKALAGKIKAPAVLCLHPTDNRIGHKVVVGLGGRANRQYAHELALRGYVTLSPSYPLLANYQPDLKKLGYRSGTMKAIWDNIRGIDLLESLPYVKKGGVGAIGHSLGGHNAVYTAVFDQRIKVIVTSCGLDSYLDYKDGNIKGWTSTRYMPRLLDYKDRLKEIPFDFHEMIGALAPRHCFISAPLHDNNFKWKSVDRIAKAASQVYRLHCVPKRLQVEYPDCDHDFPDKMRQTAYRLFDAVLRDKAASSKRKNSPKDNHLSKTRVTSEAVKSAIRKSLRLLEKGSAGSAKRRKCFTCHNQALPVLAFVEARKRGFSIDEDNLKLQIKHTAAYLNRRKTNLLTGRGKTIIEAYALWALEAGGWKSDETTAAVTGFLLQSQRNASHWRNPGHRPPSVGSDFTTTYVALRGLAAFGTEEQQPKIEARRKTVRKWLLNTTPRDTEDRVFRLRAFQYVDADEKTVRKAAAELLGLQRKDGGWAQTSDMNSDAYATGSVLVALICAGDVKTDHPAVRRGVQYLVDTQQTDGSWHVKTRAKPFQTYFESGFPHGKDQFISIAASSWATLALLLEFPPAGPTTESPRRRNPPAGKPEPLRLKQSDLDRFFRPPAKYAGDFGDFRSPLKFYDGRVVKTVKDWQARRREILERWHKIMGCGYRKLHPAQFAEISSNFHLLSGRVTWATCSASKLCRRADRWNSLEQGIIIASRKSLVLMPGKHGIM